MKYSKWLIMAGVVTALGFGTTVQATPILGGIGLSGSFSDNASGDLSAATVITVLSTTLNGGTQTFLGATLTQGLFTPINVNPAGNLVGNVFFKVTVSGVVYTFTVNSEAQGATTADSLALTGAGTFSNTLGDTAAGTWQLNFGAIGGVFTWQSTSGVTVPDGGTTVLLLGAALSAMGLLRRKLIA